VLLESTLALPPSTNSASLGTLTRPVIIRGVSARTKACCRNSRMTPPYQTRRMFTLRPAEQSPPYFYWCRLKKPAAMTTGEELRAQRRSNFKSDTYWLLLHVIIIVKINYNFLRLLTSFSKHLDHF
jgi:hypothetical protein